MFAQNWQGDAIDAVIEASHQQHLTIKQELESGRDKLLELNSSGQGRAQGNC